MTAPRSMKDKDISHIPVMLEEMLRAMNPADGEIYVDGTFGAGGYSKALLSAVHCTVYAIDRDPSVAHFAEALTQQFPGRFYLLMGRFSEMLDLLAAQGITSVNGIVLDLGVSSMQIDQSQRGFSFREDGPLDMRMGSDGMSAEEIVNRASEADLADILYHYGEERDSRRIARAIVRAREQQPITRTGELADIVHRAVRRPPTGTDSATRTFQALRIYVNQELEELQSALEAAQALLAPGGRLVVVTFHSLEDRIVKRFFQ